MTALCISAAAAVLVAIGVSTAQRDRTPLARLPMQVAGPGGGHGGVPPSPDRVEELLGHLALALGLGLSVWLGIGFAAALAAGILGRRGRRTAAHSLSSLAPPFLRVLAAALLGLQLSALHTGILNVSVLGAAPAQAVALQVAAVVDASPIDDSVSDATFGDGATIEGATMEDPRWRDSGTVDQSRPRQQPFPQWASPEAGSLLAPLPRHPEPTPAPEVQPVTVIRGDTLWSIAARHLGPAASVADIAAAWPRWHRHNQGIIGDNPHLLLPGQILHPPPAS